MDDRSNIDVRGATGRIKFDDLHSGFFQHRPYPSAPHGTDVEEMFPNTLFFQRKPVFFTDTASPLSKNRLHEAYTLFGRIHVADVERKQYLTLSPSPRPQAGAFRRYEFDQGLDRFVRTVRAYEKHFGKNAVTVLYGPDLFRSESDRRDLKYRYRDIVPWRDIRTAETIPRGADLSSDELRELIRQHRFVKVGSTDGRAALVMRFDADGTLQEGTFCVLDNIERDLRAPT